MWILKLTFLNSMRNISRGNSKNLGATNYLARKAFQRKMFPAKEMILPWLPGYIKLKAIFPNGNNHLLQIQKLKNSVQTVKTTTSGIAKLLTAWQVQCVKT